MTEVEALAVVLLVEALVVEALVVFAVVVVRLRLVEWMGSFVALR